MDQRPAADKFILSCIVLKNRVKQDLPFPVNSFYLRDLHDSPAAVRQPRQMYKNIYSGGNPWMSYDAGLMTTDVTVPLYSSVNRLIAAFGPHDNYGNPLGAYFYTDGNYNLDEPGTYYPMGYITIANQHFAFQLSITVTEEIAEEYYNEGMYDDGYYEDEYSEDDYSEDEYSEDEYSEDEYSEDEYSEDEYSEDEYSEDEYSEDEYYADDYSEEDYSEDEYSEDTYEDEGYYEEDADYQAYDDSEES